MTSNMVNMSMERYLIRQLTFVNLIIVFLLMALLWRLSVGLLFGSFVLLLVSMALGYISHNHYRTVMLPYITACQHLDAIQSDDFRLRAQRVYEHGTVGAIQYKLNDLSETLQNQKARYDKSIYLMYSLIEQLDTPMLMLNSHGELIRANDAFSRFHGQSWHLLRKYKVNQLGLIKKEQHWQLSDGQKNNCWEVRHSNFRSDEQTYELLVLIDLEVTIRKTQQGSWQKIIRVLSHEINNSLAPIQSLAQSISENEPVSESGKKVLNIIYERSLSLQKFVNEYVTVSKPQQPQCQNMSSHILFNNVAALFKNRHLQLKGTSIEFWADPTLMEQVLINLVKNAFEACDDAPQVSMDCTQYATEVIIKVTDNGHGIQNPENIMTPFYTTKKNGQGLGLDICRNLVESQKGQLVLQNRKENKGTEAIIILPLFQTS